MGFGDEMTVGEGKKYLNVSAAFKNTAWAHLCLCNVELVREGICMSLNLKWRNLGLWNSSTIPPPFFFPPVVCLVSYTAQTLAMVLLTTLSPSHLLQLTCISVTQWGTAAGCVWRQTPGLNAAGVYKRRSVPWGRSVPPQRAPGCTPPQETAAVPIPRSLR